MSHCRIWVPLIPGILLPPTQESGSSLRHKQRPCGLSSYLLSLIEHSWPPTCPLQVTSMSSAHPSNSPRSKTCWNLIPPPLRRFTRLLRLPSGFITFFFFSFNLSPSPLPSLPLSFFSVSFCYPGLWPLIPNIYRSQKMPGMHIMTHLSR